MSCQSEPENYSDWQSNYSHTSWVPGTQASWLFWRLPDNPKLTAHANQWPHTQKSTLNVIEFYTFNIYIYIYLWFCLVQVEYGKPKQLGQLTFLSHSSINHPTLVACPASLYPICVWSAALRSARRTCGRLTGLSTTLVPYCKRIRLCWLFDGRE